MYRQKTVNPDVHYYSKRLEKKLARIPGYKSVVVVAPTGYGKTTAVSEWLPEGQGKVRRFIAARESHKVGWLRFCRELQKIDNDAGEKLLQLGEPTETTQGEIAQIIRDVACKEDTYLVCDNFHNLQKSLTPDIWDALLHHSSFRLHFVIITQLQPDCAEIMTSNSGVLVIDCRDLSLTEEEIGEYYALAGVVLEKEEKKALYQFSEGWVVVLYLQLVSCLENNSFEEKNGVHELIENIFWKNITEQERDFIFRMSPFKHVTIPQACFLLGVEQLPAGTAELLNRRNLIRYNHKTRRYYPHHALADFVDAMFQDMPEHYRREALYRAGEWCELQHEKIQALLYYARLKDYDRMLRIDFDTMELKMYSADWDGIYAILCDIFDNAPRRIKEKYPRRLIMIAVTFFLSGDKSRFLNACREIGKIIETANLKKMDGRERKCLKGEHALLCSFAAYNDIKGMSEGHRRALRLFGGHATSVSVGELWTFGWPSVLGMFHSKAGELDQELRDMDECIPLYSYLLGGSGASAEIIMHAEAYYLRGDPRQAEIVLYKALYHAHTKRQISLFLAGLFAFMRISVYNGDTNSFENAMEEMKNSLRDFQDRYSQGTALMIGAYIATQLDAYQLVPSRFMEHKADRRVFLPACLPFLYMVRCKIFLLRKEYRQLLMHIERYEETAKEWRSLLSVIYFHIYKASALNGIGYREKAIHELARALDLAMPDSLLMPLVENVEYLSDFLEETCAATGRTGEYEQIVRQFACYNKGRTALMAYCFAKGNTFSLTDRELETVELAAEGLRNREIAARQYVSENTVKMHLKSAFVKMGVTSRSQLRGVLQQENADQGAKRTGLYDLLEKDKYTALWGTGR